MLFTDKKPPQNTVPGVPSFYVDDDSKVTVTETRTAFQRSMAREGFTSTAIEANAYVWSPIWYHSADVFHPLFRSGLPFGKSLSASAALTEENSYKKEKLDQETDFTLKVAYKVRGLLAQEPRCLIH